MAFCSVLTEHREMTVLFFRGLNTFGDEDFRMGPLRFGPAHKPLFDLLQKKGIILYPLYEMGVGNIWEMAERAAQYLFRSEAWRRGDRFHIIAHSTGGLAARAFLQIPKVQKRVFTLTTIGTPHHGCYIADQVHDFHKKQTSLFLLLKIVGYDLKSRRSWISHLSHPSVREFNESCPDIGGIQYGHLMCALQKHELSWPYLLGYRNVHNPEIHDLSDGLIEAQSQVWGKEVGSFQLEHAAQIGYFLYMKPSLKKRARAQFEEMVDRLVKYWRS